MPVRFPGAVMVGSYAISDETWHSPTVELISPMSGEADVPLAVMG
jgi:hypothetical protein